MLRALSAAALGLAALSASPALALDQETLSVHVPFAFNVAEKTLPAGDYTVRSLSDGQPPVVEIRSTDGRYAALALTLNASPGARGTKPELVFDKYGTKDFLHAVRLPEETGVVLEPSPAELQAARGTKAASTGLGSAR